jgi:hypothetical protein
MLSMARVSMECKNLVVILDHVDFLGNLEWDDVFVNGLAILPTMISPLKEGIRKLKDINVKPFMKNLRPRKLDPSGQGTRACVEDDDKDIEDEYDKIQMVLQQIVVSLIVSMKWIKEMMISLMTILMLWWRIRVAQRRQTGT